MQNVKRYMSGRHTPVEIRWHLAALTLGYWGLVFCAWLGYPAKNHFSVMTRTLSALGSFDERHNPDWYWVFSIAMIYCGMAMIPVMLYIRRKCATISSTGAAIGAFFFLTGCAGLVLTGLFPDGHGKFLGIWQCRHLHVTAAGSMGFAFALGIIWHGLLLLKDRFSEKTFDTQEKFPYLKFAGPYLVCLSVFIILGARIRWGSIYAPLHAAARASGHDAVGLMYAVTSGLHSFTLLEHLAIWALTIYVIWFTILLHNKP